MSHHQMKKQKLNRKHKYRIVKQVPIDFQQNFVSYLVTSARGRRHKACDEFINLLQEELSINKEENNEITKLSIKDQIKLEMNQLNQTI